MHMPLRAACHYKHTEHGRTIAALLFDMGRTTASLLPNMGPCLRLLDQRAYLRTRPSRNNDNWEGRPYPLILHDRAFTNFTVVPLLLHKVS